MSAICFETQCTVIVLLACLTEQIGQRGGAAAAGDCQAGSRSIGDGDCAAVLARRRAVLL